MKNRTARVSLSACLLVAVAWGVLSGLKPAVSASGVQGAQALRTSFGDCRGPTVCFPFVTLGRGSQSGFGDYCQDLDAAAPSTGESTGESSGQPCYVPVARPRFEAIIRDECVWEDFWNEHASISFPAPPPPPVDFDEFVVVVVMSGVRSNGCYGIEITNISLGPCNTRRVHVRERVPCPSEPCPAVITNNFHFVQVCKEALPGDAPIAFEHENPFPPCRTVACH